MTKTNSNRYKILTVICSMVLTVAIGYLIVWAGNLEPPAAPADTMVTLDDIYHRLDKDAGAPASWGLNPSASPVSTMHTLQEIYDITPDFRGNSGTAVVGDVCNSATFYKDSATKLTGTRTDCSPASGYTWTKRGAGSWVGVNENLNWVEDIGGTNYWESVEYTYCAGATACTVTADNATLQAAATYTGPPGGWNGSQSYNSFNNSALHRYIVIAADSTNLGSCTADKGDLVFPDGSVWDKSYTKPYATTVASCGPDAGNDIWVAAGGSADDKQYGYARNAPSALSIADAWDGIKDLTSGVNGTHTYTNTGKNDDYYDRPSESWYSAGGTSRLPMIEEYEQGRQGTSSTTVSLLYGESTWSVYNWSAEQYPANASHARYFYPDNGAANTANVYYQTYRLWVVVAQ